MIIIFSKHKQEKTMSPRGLPPNTHGFFLPIITL